MYDAPAPDYNNPSGRPSTAKITYVMLHGEGEYSDTQGPARLPIAEGFRESNLTYSASIRAALVASTLMASNSNLSSAPSKNVNSSPQLLSPSQSQAPCLPSHEGFSQRRTGSSGSFGPGVSVRSTTTAGRNNQSFRRQHKVSKRPQLGDEDAAAESAAIRSTSSRKGQTSITHLMNFTLPPRPQAFQNTNHGRYARRNPTWGLGSGHHAIDKARYIHANYRFIVDPRGNYHTQAIDADIHLDWNLVLQILASAQSQLASCPICLSTPVAPRMAKCGHIFCLPCLIRYMHSTDDVNPMPEKKARWKKCPICWDSVYLSDTRAVRWFVGQEVEAPREGGDVVLRLMMRQAGSTLALPRDGADSLSTNDEIPWYFAAEVTDYARIMRGTEEYMISHFDREVQELQLQEKEDELMFGEETIWTRKAVNAILEAKEKVKGIGNPPTAPKKPEDRKLKRPPIIFHESDDEVPDFYMVQHAAKSGQSISRGINGAHSAFTSLGLLSAPDSDETLNYQRPVDHQAVSGSRAPPLPVNAQSKGAESEHGQYNSTPYFFYQALLHYYLSPLDIRILKKAFGDFSSFPSTILPRVERVSTGHMVDDDLRRRAKYLAHLPYGCEVGFLECNWDEVVAPDILQEFTGEIERRRRKNTEKEVREEKERLRAEKSEDDKRWAAARRKKPSVSLGHSPAAEASTSVETGEARRISSSIDLTAPSTSPPWLSSQNRNRSAFASLASPSTSPVAPRTVWGTTAVVPISPPLLPASHGHESTENDGWLQGWEQDLLQEDEIISHLHIKSLPGDDSPRIASTNGNGKKKKHKKITLMTTNARRAA